MENTVDAKADDQAKDSGEAMERTSEIVEETSRDVLIGAVTAEV
eukprot:CAMPEP_0194060068 /NCGR_PEP_ID=MMETSP0009_2-20130614/70776_1 /TAXON_ID=210454 /ORGANISM="Grammatophora oceanica, Strain CCMP 410" /LENGTH=43 /DNA_ID= /DNA_START= /DNA_END= /DNA_ORIENTATION=